MKARYLVVCLGLLDLTHEIYLTVKKLSKKYDISEIKVQGQYISVSSYMYEFKTQSNFGPNKIMNDICMFVVQKNSKSLQTMKQKSLRRSNQSD